MLKNILPTFNHYTPFKITIKNFLITPISTIFFSKMHKTVLSNALVNKKSPKNISRKRKMQSITNKNMKLHRLQNNTSLREVS